MNGFTAGLVYGLVFTIPAYFFGKAVGVREAMKIVRQVFADTGVKGDT